MTRLKLMIALFKSWNRYNNELKRWKLYALALDNWQDHVIEGECKCDITCCACPEGQRLLDKLHLTREAVSNYK